MINGLSRFFYWAHCICDVHKLADQVSCLEDDLHYMAASDRKRRRKKQLRQQQDAQQSAQTIQTLISTISTTIGTYLGNKVDKPASRPVAPGPGTEGRVPSASELAQQVGDTLAQQLNEQFDTMSRVFDKRLSSLEVRMSATEKGQSS